MMSPVHALLKTLIPCRCAHRAQICAALDFTIAQFEDAVSACSAYGIALLRQPDGRYCLPRALELLDADAMIQVLSPSQRSRLSRIDIFPCLDSTNRYLLEQPPLPNFHVCFAEYQHQGRGRGDHIWLSPYASGLCLSLRWNSTTPPGAALSLALGVAVAEALTLAGVEGIGIKWPNDIWWQQRAKLAGLLLESRSTPTQHSLVIGLGLNIALPADAPPPATTAWIDLQHIMATPLGRNQVAGLMLSALMSGCARFAAHGLEAFMPLWQRFDVLKDKNVTLIHAQTTHTGIARGIDAEGALLLETQGQIYAYFSAEVSVQR
jgi:BirA family transcriptional regulator, biotin operon repressor / biotin---[acetyl-CoA-carboxylase] ligase